MILCPGLPASLVLAVRFFSQTTRLQSQKGIRTSSQKDTREGRSKNRDPNTVDREDEKKRKETFIHDMLSTP